MQKKLYIPTSTLNFNNIISTESISPYSFYLLRGYGYKRFNKVQANELDNSVLLYDKFPSFDVDATETENYPMVVEICRDTCSAHIEPVGNGVYRCTETIYLNPFNTRFLFKKTGDLIATKSRSECSIESKLVNLYAGCYKVLDASVNTERYNYGAVHDSELDIKALEADKRNNKLKGFIYAYVIASNRSNDGPLVNLKMHSKQLLNCISSIITAPYFKREHLCSSEMTSMYDLIRQDIEAIDGIPEEVDRIIRDKTKEYQCSNLASIFEKEGLFDTWCDKIKSEYNLRPRVELSQFKLENMQDGIRQLDNYGSYLRSVESGFEVGTLLPLKELPIIKEGRIDSIPCQKTEFVANLLNLYLDKNIDKDSFLANRYQYSIEGGGLFKDSLGDEWAGSKAQAYVNALLKNLNEYAAFDINSVNNITLKSFAAFFQKGDVEMEKLEDYLISCGIGDLRIAFSLWGVVFGFAEMPKTITCDFFDSKDTDYKCCIYKAIYKNLYGVQISNDLSLPVVDHTFEKRNSCCEGLANSSRYSSIVNSIFESDDFNALNTDAQAFYKEEAIKILVQKESMTDDVLYEQLSSLGETGPKGTKTKWKSAIKPFKPSCKKAKKSITKERGGSGLLF